MPLTWLLQAGASWGYDLRRMNKGNSTWNFAWRCVSSSGANGEVEAVRVKAARGIEVVRSPSEAKATWTINGMRMYASANG